METNQQIFLTDYDPLALAVDKLLLDELADGVWFIQFDSVSELGRFLSVVASTLGVCEVSDRPLAACLIETLREKELLLIPSHYADLAGVCAQFVETIL